MEIGLLELGLQIYFYITHICIGKVLEMKSVCHRAVFNW